MWRTLRNRHLAATAGGVRAHVSMMMLAALTGVAFLLADFPPWRVAVIVLLPTLMGAFEYIYARRIDPDRFDRVYMKLSWLGLFVLGGLVTVTNGLSGPMAPFLLLGALMPIFLFGDLRFIYWQHARVIAILAIIGFLPDEALGPPLTRTQHAVIAIVVASSLLYIVTVRVRQFIDAAAMGLRELDRMREERLAEAEERLVRMQSVSSRIAHELKNPLAAIKSLVQLTMKSVPDADRERLGVAQDEIARMETILRDYLSFSRPLDDLKPAPVNIAEVVADVREILAARAEGAGITLEPDTTPVTVAADARRLKEALLNLTSNAIEATPPGGRVYIACRPVLLGAEITVRDTGRGMDADELARVGTPFFTTRAEGTGLGVHLARGVVAQHGGTVTFTSARGVGTTATMTLPQHPPECLSLEVRA